MRIMGLDYGEAAIGIAISDELGLTAQALKTIRRRSWKEDVRELGKIIERFDVKQIVVGMPYNMDGSMGAAAERTRRFIAKLKVAFNIPIVAIDERLSTVSAEQILIAGGVKRNKRKEVIDSLAAAIILQQHLDRIQAA